MTRREATEKWVGEFNAIPYGMIEALYKADSDSWQELTKPRIDDVVYHYPTGETGEIVDIDIMSEDCVVRIGDENVLSGFDDITVEHDSVLPMWGTLWSFGTKMDDYWLEEQNGLALMSECGFRIYEHEEFGYFFGIDGAGYDFYEQHWMPLYEARGLQWHEVEKETLDVRKGDYVNTAYGSGDVVSVDEENGQCTVHLHFSGKRTLDLNEIKAIHPESLEKRAEKLSLKQTLAKYAEKSREMFGDTGNSTPQREEVL